MIIKFWSSLFRSLLIPFNCRVFCIDQEKKIWSGTDSFEKFFAKNSGSEIRKYFYDFLKKEKIRTDLYFIQGPIINCISYGSNRFFFSKFVRSDAAIFLTERFFETDREACSFIIKHELSHIKFHDLFWGAFLVLLTLVLLIIAMSCVFDWVAIVLSLLYIFPFIGFCLNKGWMWFCEYRADRFAISRSSEEELEGGIRYLAAMKYVTETHFLSSKQNLNLSEKEIRRTHKNRFNACEKYKELRKKTANKLFVFRVLRVFYSLFLFWRGDGIEKLEYRSFDQRIKLVQKEIFKRKEKHCSNPEIHKLVAMIVSVYRCL